MCSEQFIANWTFLRGFITGILLFSAHLFMFWNIIQYKRTQDKKKVKK